MKRIQNHFDIEDNSKIAKFREYCDDELAEDKTRRKKKQNQITSNQIELELLQITT